MKLNDSGLQVGAVGDLTDRYTDTALLFGRSGPGFEVAPDSVRFIGDKRRVRYLSAPDSNDLDLPFEFGIHFWVRLEALQVDQSTNLAFLNKENSYEIGVSPSREIMVALYTDQGSWQWRSSGVYLPLWEWTHIAWTYSKLGDPLGTHTIYINGKYASSFTNNNGGNPAANSNPLRIGARSSGVEPLDFSIAELRIWGDARHPNASIFRPLTASERTDTALRAYWTFNGPDDLNDKAGGGNDFAQNQTSYTRTPQILSGGPVWGGGENNHEALAVAAHPFEGPNGESVWGFWRSTDKGGQAWKNGLSNPLFHNPRPDTPNGWSRSLNGELDLAEWGMYVSGVSDPSSGYHAHLDPAAGLFGGSAVVMPNENDHVGHKGRLLRLEQNITAFIQNTYNISNDQVTVSLYAKATNPNMRVAFGIYHFDSSLNETYETSPGQGIYVSPPIGVVDEWVRFEHTWTIDTNNFDVNSQSFLHVFGQNTTEGLDNPEGRIWIAAPQIEFNEFASGFASSQRHTHSGYEASKQSWNETWNGKLTVAGWMKAGKGTGAHHLFHAKTANNSFEIELYESGNDAKFRVKDAGGSATELTGAGVFADGGWHHVVATLEELPGSGHNGRLKLWVDGAEVSGSPATTSGSIASPDFNYVTLGAYSQSSAGGLNGPVHDLVVDPWAIWGQAEVQEAYERGRPRGENISYDGTTLRVRNIVEGRYALPMDTSSNWTIIDPARAMAFGAKGRGAWDWEYGEHLPYGPWGSSIWMGPVVVNHISRFHMGGFHGWHSGIASYQYYYAAQNGRWWRIPIYNISSGKDHSELLMSARADVQANKTYLMQFLYRSNGAGTGATVNQVTFFGNSSGHNVVPVTNIHLSGKTWLAYATFTVTDSSDTRIRMLDIFSWTKNGATWFEIADPMFVQTSRPQPFRWGMRNANNNPQYRNSVTALNFARASDILDGSAGTIIIPWNPASDQPDPTGRIFEAGTDSANHDRDMAALLWGSNYTFNDSGGTHHDVRLVVNDGGAGTQIISTGLGVVFSPWTWYFLVLRWDNAAKTAWLDAYDSEGTKIGGVAPTWSTGNWPVFTNLSNSVYDTILFNRKHGVADSSLSILGPVAINHAEKISDQEVEEIIRRMTRGRVSFDGATMHVFGEGVDTSV